MKTIVVGADGSADSRRAVEWAVELAADTGARVVAVHAVGLLEHERGDPLGAHLEPELDAWTSALDRLGSGAERRLVAGEPVGALMSAAREEGADLLVVGSRGTGSPSGAGLGSTSLHLAQAGGVALVVVPPPPA